MGRTRQVDYIQLQFQSKSQKGEPTFIVTDLNLADVDCLKVFTGKIRYDIVNQTKLSLHSITVHIALFKTNTFHKSHKVMKKCYNETKKNSYHTDAVKRSETLIVFFTYCLCNKMTAFWDNSSLPFLP